MPTLVPIGRFAQRTGLTIKALRLYDKLGLLRPGVGQEKAGDSCVAAYLPPRTLCMHDVRSSHVTLLLIKNDLPLLWTVRRAGSG